MEALALASSIVSIAIAVGAIWLSITFYRMSSDSSTQSHEAAKDLEASVARLEKLFDRLYSDMFGMMRDTVTDMRRHIWPEEEAIGNDQLIEMDRRADQKAEDIRQEFEQQLSSVIQRLGGTDAKIDEMRGEMMKMIPSVITRSRNVDAQAKEETLRQALLRHYRNASRRGIVTADELTRQLSHDGFRLTDALSELVNMKNDEILHWHSGLSPKTEIFWGPTTSTPSHGIGDQDREGYAEASDRPSDDDSRTE